MIPFSLPLPSWSANIAEIVFLIIFGKILIPKILNLLRNFLDASFTDTNLTNSFINLVSSLFWLYVLGRSLVVFPQIFSPDIFPIDIVGNLILTFVGYAFSLILPITVLIFLSRFIRTK
ncbi:MAG: hypothetical protein QW197_03050 [Candidatus Aenigmatarchaeota archaeon]